jgi:hypothetical protein
MGLPALGAPIASPKTDASARTMMQAPSAASAPTAQTPAVAERPHAEPVGPRGPAPAEAARAVAASKAEAARPAAQPAGKAAAQGKAFRETAWFKQGEVDEEMAKQAAKMASEDPLAPTGSTGKHHVVEAGDLTAQDRARLSLKSGTTQQVQHLKGSGSVKALPGERMDVADMLAEIDSSRKWFIVAGIIVGVVVLAVILYFTLWRSAPSAEAPLPPKPAAVVAPVDSNHFPSQASATV